jgi:hypothetical protein
MSYEGRHDLHNSDGRDDADEWPPKLSALGEQLSDDARMLARRYPAPDARHAVTFEATIAEALHDDSGCSLRGTNVEQSYMAADRTTADTAAGFSRTSLRWSIATGICAAALFVAMAIWQTARPWVEPDNEVQSAEANIPRERPTVVFPVARDGGLNHDEEASRDADFLRGLSAAEQEAVLDLLEDDSERSMSLSI